MTKQDKLLIYKGEMISEIADSGLLSAETMREYKAFMVENFATTEECKALVYIEVLNAIGISNISGNELNSSLDNMLLVFEMEQSRADIVSVITAVNSLQTVSYSDGVAYINTLKETTTDLPHIDLTRARMLLSVAIANNVVEDIREYTAVLRECSSIVETQKAHITWESQDV